MHDWANTLAGSKEVFRNKDLSSHIFLCHLEKGKTLPIGSSLDLPKPGISQLIVR
jgi:hypothetical protein